MGALAWISQGLSSIMGWMSSFTYDGLTLRSVLFYVFIGACVCRFILPLFIPQFSWRDKGSDGVRRDK